MLSCYTLSVVIVKSFTVLCVSLIIIFYSEELKLTLYMLLI